MTAHLAHAATRRLRICRRLRGVRASRTVQGGRKDSLKRPESGQGRPDRTSVQTDLVVQSEHSHRVSEKEKAAIRNVDRQAALLSRSVGPLSLTPSQCAGLACMRGSCCWRHISDERALRSLDKR